MTHDNDRPRGDSPFVRWSWLAKARLRRNRAPAPGAGPRARCQALIRASPPAAGPPGSTVRPDARPHDQTSGANVSCVPIGLVVAALATRVLPESERRTGRFDLPGAITGTLGIASLVYGLSNAAPSESGGLMVPGRVAAAIRPVPMTSWVGHLYLGDRGREVA